MNTISLTGGLTRDPELRSTPAGKSVCDMRVAVTRSRNRDQSDYFDVVAWEGLADICAEHLTKGRQIAVTGRINYREWQAEDSTKRHDYSVIAENIDFLDRPPATVDDEAPETADPAGTEEPAPF